MDRPDFEGHQANWDSMVLRLRQFLSEEDRSHNLWDRANCHRPLSKPRVKDRAKKREGELQAHLGEGFSA